MEARQKSRLILGKEGEEAAVRFLRKKKYEVVVRGYKLFRGEIDIITYDRNRTLVFVEVKTRTTENFGPPEESVTPAKQEQIRKIAQGFVVKNRLGDVPCRFDVISVLMPAPGHPVIRHIENAF